MHDIILELDRAHDDPEVPSAEFQAELRTVTAQLRSAGIEYSQRGMAFDAVDAIGYPLAAFAIKHWGTIAAPPPWPGSVAPGYRPGSAARFA